MITLTVSSVRIWNYQDFDYLPVAYELTLAYYGYTSCAFILGSKEKTVY